MLDVKEHGRRRAPVPEFEAPAADLPSRRDALAAERTRAVPTGGISQLVGSGLRSGIGQKAGMVLAATGLALAVTLPSTGMTLASVDTPAPTAPAVVSAAADVPVTFAAPAVASALNADGQLQETLKVEAANVAPQASKGTLSAPLKELNTSSPFGARLNPLTGELGEIHTGQDFAVACSTSVFAAAGGTVTFAGWHPYGGGNRVVIDHGNGLSTSYNHLSSISVAVGTQLERGDLVALSGTTGASTGCHLHFEVMVNDETVDPTGWL